MYDTATKAELAEPAREEQEIESFVTFTVGDHFLGVPIGRVQDILVPDVIAPVPGGPIEVSGLINLRGRIVTVIDLRARLSLPPPSRETSNRGKCVTVEKDGEFYTLLVDAVGDVVILPAYQRESNPPTLDPLWQNIVRGVFRQQDNLLIILDVDRVLDLDNSRTEFNAE